jgi:hypothetical protein
MLKLFNYSDVFTLTGDQIDRIKQVLDTPGIRFGWASTNQSTIGWKPPWLRPKKP